ncbi:MAG: BamA/TamA family outer membrane protein [Bernardetiaceae bacterium]|nr:BamA/TamA family outer membrane protein [Bernardetiaceae bacterium]
MNLRTWLGLGSILWLLSAVTPPAWARPGAALPPHLDTLRTDTASQPLVERKDGLFLIPLLYYTPDTRWAAGAMGIYYFKLKNHRTNQTTRLSWIKFLADYTQNRQLDLWSSWSVFLRDEQWILKGELRYRNFPDRFYGVGNNTPESNMEQYQYNLIDIKKLVLRQVGDHWYLGGDIRIAQYFDMSYGPDGQLATGAIAGSRGGWNVGLGGVALLDTRDNVVFPRKGAFFEASTYWYNRAFGSNFNYVNINLIHNRYYPVGDKSVFAWQVVGNYNLGNPPFVMMAPAGGDDILRGYARNRFRANNFTGAQAEYRFPLFWRFGGVVFAGAGDVFNDPADLSSRTFKYSYGGGLRFLFNRKENLNIRFDYGFGRDISNFYLTLTEAF